MNLSDVILKVMNETKLPDGVVFLQTPHGRKVFPIMGDTMTMDCGIYLIKTVAVKAEKEGEPDTKKLSRAGIQFHYSDLEQSEPEKFIAGKIQEALQHFEAF